MPKPKFMTRDAEFLTAGSDAKGNVIPPWKITQLLLDHVNDAFADTGFSAWSGANWGHFQNPNARRETSRSTDCLRRWLPNGCCVYSDMSHFESCTAETTDPYQFAAQSIAALQTAESIRKAVLANHPDIDILLSAHNADGRDPGISWGTHLNCSISNELWEDLFLDLRHPAVLGFVSSALAAAVPWFGSGYLMPLNDGSTLFSLSQRAHHLGKLISLSTVDAFERAILNSRREPHGEHDRLHLICFDYNLASAALLCNFMQCLLAAAEEGYCGSNHVYDPVNALRSWSWGFSVSSERFVAVATMTDGRKLTLPVYIRELAEFFLKMVEDGLITDDIAPNAPELLDITIGLTHYAEEGSVEKLARHLDWAAKFMLLKNLHNEGVSMGAPTSVLFDQDYSNTDVDRGHFWRLWKRQMVDPLVEPEMVHQCRFDGPSESRAWARGKLIQKFGSEITNLNWSKVELRRDSLSRWGRRLKLEMPSLDSLNEAAFKEIILAARDVAHLESLLIEANATENARFDPTMQISNELAAGRLKA